MKGTTMTARLFFRSFVLMFVLIFQAYAGGKGELQNYFNNTAHKVKATNDPSEKRAILTTSFQTMLKALEIVKHSPGVSKEDGRSLDRVKASIQEKQDELAGTNGYVRVSDAQLNNFSNYVVQDMEQADQIVSISLVTLLLIVIVVILLV